MNINTNRGDAVISDERSAFTLVELLVVIGLIVLLASLVVPAFSGLNRAGGAAKAYYDIAGLLENARTYAIANSTYVFVGFAEKDVSQPPTGAQKPGIGRVLIAAIASRDGTRGYDYFDSVIPTAWKARYTKNSNGRGQLVEISKLQTFENIHIAATVGPPPATGSMAREDLSSATYQNQRLGSTFAISETPFTWPLGLPLGPTTAAGQVYFDKVVMFDSSGIARMQAAGQGDKINQFLEIDLQQTRGAVDPGPPADPATGNYAAIMINGLTGAVKIYRP